MQGIYLANFFMHKKCIFGNSHTFEDYTKKSGIESRLHTLRFLINVPTLSTKLQNVSGFFQNILYTNFIEILK